MTTLSSFSLAGKTAVVTGCDTGSRQGMATALAEAGADIAGASIVDDYLATKSAIEATGRKFTYYKVDISDRDQLYAFINKVKAEHSKIDILVNNAGIIMRKPAAEHPDEYWDKVIDINLNAQFNLGREFGKQMIETGGDLPPRSTHFGFATSNCGFIWDTAGENLVYTDMDPALVPELR